MLAAARRQARVVGFAAAVGGLLGLAYAISATPHYTATTDLLIDSQKDKNDLSASIAELTFDTGAIDSQVEVLKSEKIALAVIATLNLTRDPEFMGARGTLIGQAFAVLRSMLDFVGWFVSRQRSVAEADESLERAAIDRLRSDLDVRRVARTYVLAIDYTSPDRDKAATIANAFAEAYLTDQLDGKFEATRRAAGWLQSRIAELKQQSIDSDLAVQKFKADNGIVVTGGDRPGLMSDQQLTQLNEQMVLARADTGQRGGALPANRGPDQFGPRRRVGSRFARQSGHQRPARKIPRRVEDGGAARRQARPPAPASHQSARAKWQEFERLISEELRADRRKLSQRRRGRAREGAVAALSNVRTGGRERRHQPDAGSVARAGARSGDLSQSLSGLHAALSRGAAAAILPGHRGAGDHRGDAAARLRRRSVATILALSLVLGAMVGGGLGALREYRDRVFRVAAACARRPRPRISRPAASVQNDCRGQGRRPILRPFRAKRRPPNSLLRYSIDHPLSSSPRRCARPRSRSILSLAAQRSKVIGVVSALPNEGKSTLAKNFGSLLAHLGASCLLIDGDMRNPGLTLAIARHAEVGLLEVVRGERRWARRRCCERDSGLKFLPAVITKRAAASERDPLLAGDARAGRRGGAQLRLRHRRSAAARARRRRTRRGAAVRRLSVRRRMGAHAARAGAGSAVGPGAVQ